MPALKKKLERATQGSPAGRRGEIAEVDASDWRGSLYSKSETHTRVVDVYIYMRSVVAGRSLGRRAMMPKMRLRAELTLIVHKFLQAR